MKTDRGSSKGVFRRLQRVQLGNFGDNRGVGYGIRELRLHFGKGYRIYNADDGPDTVVLLSAGDKGSRPSDVKRAKRNWDDYLMNKEG